MGVLMQDVRFAMRTLWKSPTFTAVAVLALALGIGANSAIFTVVNSVVLEPLPFPHPERLSVIYTAVPGAPVRFGMVEDAAFLEFEKQNTTFEQVAAIAGGPTSLTGFGEPIRINSQAVTEGFWPVLGVSPVLGRAFFPREQNADAHVAILSDKLWRTHFSGDRSVIGRSVKLDGTPYTIIGVMPRGFAFPANTDLWTRAGVMWMRRAIGRRSPKLGIGYPVTHFVCLVHGGSTAL